MTALPERRVTFHTGDMGDTVPLAGESVMPWKEYQVVNERLRFIAHLVVGSEASETLSNFIDSARTCP